MQLGTQNINNMICYKLLVRQYEQRANNSNVRCDNCHRKRYFTNNANEDLYFNFSFQRRKGNQLCTRHVFQPSVKKYLHYATVILCEKCEHFLTEEVDSIKKMMLKIFGQVVFGMCLQTKRFILNAGIMYEDFCQWNGKCGGKIVFLKSILIYTTNQP